MYCSIPNLFLYRPIDVATPPDPLELPGAQVLRRYFNEKVKQLKFLKIYFFMTQNIKIKRRLLLTKF
jgi:hypothetical protein